MTERERQAKAIYDAYPRKAARPRALKAIEKALIRCPEHMLMNAAKEMRRLWEPCDREQRTKFPHPATFFRNDMWNDMEDFRRRFPPPKRTYPEAKPKPTYEYVCEECAWPFMSTDVYELGVKRLCPSSCEDTSRVRMEVRERWKRDPPRHKAACTRCGRKMWGDLSFPENYVCPRCNTEAAGLAVKVYR